MSTEGSPEVGVETALGSGQAGRSGSREFSIARLLEGRLGPFIGVGSVLVALVVFELLTEPTFSSAENLTSVMRAGAIPLLLAGAMAVVLLTGGVDLSMGSTLALSGIFYAKLIDSGWPAGIAFAACLLFGAVLGLCINGFLIGRLKMSFFVVTLGTLSAYRGLTFLWSNNQTIEMYGDKLSQKVGNDAILNGHIPISILIALAGIAVLYLVLQYTTFGRSVYAVGGNAEASELSGVRVPWIIASVYGISGLCAALAAVMTIGRATIADPNMGSGIELEVAAAALLGGLALSGGIGSIWGAVLGVVFLQVLSNALSLAGAPQSWQLIVTGVILVVAIFLDRLRAKRHSNE